MNINNDWTISDKPDSDGDLCIENEGIGYDTLFLTLPEAVAMANHILKMDEHRQRDCAEPEPKGE